MSKWCVFKVRAALLLGVAVPALAAGSLDAPLGGWRHSSNRDELYSQTVNYPAVRVSTQAGQAKTALIRGQIDASPKHGGPHTAIVNGVAMPLRVEEDGSFSRPYAFGSGSNGVEIRSPDGTQRLRSQFYESNPGKATAKVRVVLAWDSDGTDLDLHVITPDGQHCWYGKRVLPNGGALDVDVTSGYGPEIFSLPAAVRGAYQVYVNYYGQGNGQEDLTIASVSIVTHENTPSEKRQHFSVPMRKAGELTLVKQFVY